MKGKFVILTIGFAISFQTLAEEPIPSEKRVLKNSPSIIPAPPIRKLKIERSPEGRFSRPKLQLIAKDKKKIEETQLASSNQVVSPP